MPSFFLYDRVGFADPGGKDDYSDDLQVERMALTWAVRGGKYSKDHHTLPSFWDCSIFLLILMVKR